MADGIVCGAQISGVYRIANVVTGKIYVGSSIRLRERRRQHFADLRRNAHVNAHLQAAFNRYGEDAFRFEIIEICDPADVLAREQFYIDTLQPDYNKCPVAGSTMGYRHTEEARVKMSAISKAKPPPFLGKNHTEETRRRIAEKKRGKKLSPEHIEVLRRQRIGNKNTAGKKMPPGHAEKRRADMLAKWADPVWKAERLANLRAARRAAQIET